MPKKQPTRPTRDITIPVRCRDCANASDFIGPPPVCCHCKAMGRRVVAGDRYGRVCPKFIKK